MPAARGVCARPQAVADGRPNIGRRAADDVVSREYGARHCGAHSPTKEWPGPQGAAFSEAFAALGYVVGTTATAVQSYPRLLEVYPHPALLTLMRRLLGLQQKKREFPLGPRQSLGQHIPGIGVGDADVRDVGYYCCIQKGETCGGCVIEIGVSSPATAERVADRVSVIAAIDDRYRAVNDAATHGILREDNPGSVDVNRRTSCPVSVVACNLLE